MRYTNLISAAVMAALAPGAIASTLDDSEVAEDRHMATIESYLQAASGMTAENMLVLNERTITLPNSDRQLTIFKLEDQLTGRMQTVALDEWQSLVDLDRLIAQDQKIRFDRIGVMHESLATRVRSEGGNIPVLIQLAVKEEIVDKSLFDSEAKRADLQRASLAQESNVVSAAKDLYNNIKSEMRISTTDEAHFSGPFVSVTLPAATIERLSKDPRVLFIGPDKGEVVYDYPTITQSLPTTLTNTVHGWGNKGAGVKLAVLETGTPNISSTCFNLVSTQSGGSASSHMTKSLGIIGNRYNAGACNGSWEGYAPSASVYLANNSSYTSAYDWAKGNGVNVVTMSWHYTDEETSGSLHSRDKYFDYAASHYPYPSIFVSAGNQAGSGAYASGKGYNFMGVGNVSNDGDLNRCNNTISSDSSFKDPISTHNDREIPEIASPGSRHDLLGSNFGGTSAATPVTASIAAVLMSRNTALKSWPEAVRAIMQATANYQKADSNNFSSFVEGKDGTGLTNTYYGALTSSTRETGTTAQYRAHDYGSMSAGSFSDGYFNKSWKAKTSSTNARIRVALTWNSQTDNNSSSILKGDLDLRVYSPSGALVASSSSWDNNNEFVEFTPTQTGEYTIRIRGFSVPADLFTYYGIAWTTHYDLCN